MATTDLENAGARSEPNLYVIDIGCLIGNIDCSYVLSEASMGEVDSVVRECILKAAPGGGHVISSSNSIHSSVKAENYRTMIEATRRYGDYSHLGEPA